MTARLPREDMPARLWKLWDDFGMQNAKMVGYWSPSCPVRTDHRNVLATAYVKKSKVLIAIASWAPESVSCRLKIDWNAFDINPERAQLTVPYIEGFQDTTMFAPTDKIPVAPGKGWLLILNALCEFSNR